MYPLVCVQWLDAVALQGWCTLQDCQDVALDTVETVGYVVHRDSARIVVAGTVGKDNSFNNVIAIPRSWVVEMRYLGFGDEYVSETQE